MQLDKVKEIIDLMTANGLAEFEMEENGVRLSIKKGGAAQVVQTVAALAPPAPKAGPLAGPAPAVPVEDDDPRMAFIKAPFVGTLYRAPAPDAEPYVTVGQEVSPETVLCVVEAMKVMNEIKAEIKGIVHEVLVENAHAVQYGQPLFKIEKI
ncbi:MAG: acetyl-CoA carboxylase biotin carboxyl carrier protein [Kiritimatiellae bacterium]|nr:acetyl-CoA carboxylase biotin carboxyl carrier protein [Verrucomicrobiota bacterium]MBU4285275.1 acetyl-CoA carboxylase biotin carboxyl carrier protein [Verrucomicrobiota bacterium]MBU4365552.1 acetyl-CoA carboxylase biotin carboxyl carrier protein [Verrucomicrobiota bacterium]MCG2659378.1 acetyl-CoA carboxylase biotin carboxyl carrier protein [Kiritimatiellia bacterium]